MMRQPHNIPRPVALVFLLDQVTLSSKFEHTAFVCTWLTVSEQNLLPAFREEALFPTSLFPPSTQL